MEFVEYGTINYQNSFHTYNLLPYIYKLKPFSIQIYISFLNCQLSKIKKKKVTEIIIFSEPIITGCDDQDPI